MIITVRTVEKKGAREYGIHISEGERGWMYHITGKENCIHLTQDRYQTKEEAAVAAFSTILIWRENNE